ncbi:MAG: hypothetical protein R2797_11515 [Gelidibacter sp.]
MKKLMILTLLLTAMVGCKNNEKKEEDTTMQPNMEENIPDMKRNSVDNLQLGCYEYKADGSEVKMKVTKIEGDAVTANLYYAYAEKDKNEGTFFGNLHDDKLIGKYTFMSEGVESVRDVAFKIEKDQIVEGFGDLDEGGTMFKDTTKLRYNSTTPWKKTDCSD